MSKTLEAVDIIIPTYNNVKMLTECVSSIGATRLSYPINIIIVNNGHPASLDHIGSQSYFRVVQTGGRNLGWEGGLIEGLKHSKSEFVMFANDDIFVPAASDGWIRKMMECFRAPEVAGVGPTSNFVMGPQHMTKQAQFNLIDVPYLIGFCAMYRRKALDEVGGVDNSLSGGDDLDLSIRMRSAGHSLICRRDVFVFHYGSVTGSQLHGGSNRPYGWNSPQMTENTNIGLIRKHGFKKWFECIAGFEYPPRGKGDDHEGEIIRYHITGDKIVDLGCANNKTVPNAVGVDRIKKGDDVPFLNAVCDADVQADAEKRLPFDDGSQDTVIARHFLEHCIDPVEALTEWKRIVKHGGRVIIAVPNEDEMKTVPLNGEHLHAFTPKSLENLGRAVGLKPVKTELSNSISFVTVFERNGQ